MGTLNPKPFSPAEKIYRRIIAGKPAVYTDVDLNQQAAIDDNAFTRMQSQLGAYTTNFTPAVGITWDNNLAFAVTYTGGGKLYHNKIEFDIPAFTAVKGDSPGNPAIVVLPSPGVAAGVVNFWLVAKKYTTTFVDDATIAGVDGPGLAAPLPSTDAMRYKDERVAVTYGADTTPTLATDEESIILLAQIAFIDDDTITFGKVRPYFQHCCPDTTLHNEIFFKGVNNASTQTKGVYANLVKLADSLTAKVNNAVYNLYNTLVERRGTIKFFYGDLSTNFNSAGLGIGQWAGYALCNGATHSGYTTPDLRGRVPVGFYSAAGDSDEDYKTIGELGPPAPPVIGSVSPYALLKNGKRVKLGALSLPPHRHSYVATYIEDSGSDSENQYDFLKNLIESHSGAANFDTNSPAYNDQVNWGDSGSAVACKLFIANTGTGSENLESQDVVGWHPIENRQPYIVLAAVVKL